MPLRQVNSPRLGQAALPSGDCHDVIAAEPCSPRHSRARPGIDARLAGSLTHASRGSRALRPSLQENESANPAKSAPGI